MRAFAEAAGITIDELIARAIDDRFQRLLRDRADRRE